MNVAKRKEHRSRLKAAAIRPSVEAVRDEDWKDLVIDLLPSQGDWSEDAYLWLTDNTRRLVELNDGYLEVPPMPTDLHQTVLKALFLAFHLYLDPRGGTVQFAALRLRLRKGKIREPDLLLVKDAKDPRRQNRLWTGADLVLEVVSEDDPDRDRVDKRSDYAKAGIPEYWIVDPQEETIAVLGLRGKKYRAIATYRRGAVAKSATLPGFEVSVDAVFDAR
jgi:Uma2 family endonuclease